ncbi:unnamed protein product [Acanthoscelides obtectus]|uniref:HTH CENPB-type domain-containing protein n=1 Tax=Acanthoscelides obtectus TaxID=200917 RepID=A0A9P0LR03_ACAOB|nr:unnamed protein product [Acanthoscelides obtectus]CAK1657191.1 hypothetical protein AOBTE_LOCUS20191 [Acanthoscelides obtectus]
MNSHQQQTTHLTLKTAKHPNVETALYTWFLQQRTKNVNISGEILQEKAKFFYEEITGLCGKFWLLRPLNIHENLGDEYDDEEDLMPLAELRRRAISDEREFEEMTVLMNVISSGPDLAANEVRTWALGDAAENEQITFSDEDLVNIALSGNNDDTPEDAEDYENLAVENEDTNENDVTDASGNSPYPLPNEDKGNSNPSNDSSDSQPSQAKRCAATPDNASDDHPQHPNQEDISNFIEPLPSVYDDYDSSDHIPLSKLKQHNNNIESNTELNVVCSTTLNETYTSLCQMLKTPEKTSSPKTAPRAKAINSLAQALTKSMFTDKNNMSGPSNAPKQKIENIPGPFKVAYQKRKYSAKRNNSEAVTPKKVSKQSRGKGQSERSKDSWYCYVCNEDRIADMRICFLCETYVHEDCVGLTKEDTDKFVCTRCSLD